jgi:hypothetical protein
MVAAVRVLLAVVIRSHEAARERDGSDQRAAGEGGDVSGGGKVVELHMVMVPFGPLRSRNSHASVRAS